MLIQQIFLKKDMLGLFLPIQKRKVQTLVTRLAALPFLNIGSYWIFCGKRMVDFYQEVLSGQDDSSSLRQAKRELLAKPETAAPHY